MFTQESGAAPDYQQRYQTTGGHTIGSLRDNTQQQPASPLLNPPPYNRSSTSASSDSDGPTKTVRWGIHWRTPTFALVLFLTSLGCALAHHFYFQSLHHTRVKSTSQQEWALRIGNGLATVHKMCILLILETVATQQVWANVRDDYYSLNGIDGMFVLTTNAVAIFCSDIWRKGKIILLIALCCWIMPLSAVVTPATLSVESSMSHTTTPGAVPTLNMTNQDHWALYEGPGYPTSASVHVRRLFSAVYSSGSVLPLRVPSPNATYDLDFWAPSYKCINLEDSNYGDVWDKLFHLAEVPYTGTTPLKYQAATPPDLQNSIFIWSGGRKRNAAIDSQTKIVCQLFNTTFSISVILRNGEQLINPRSIEHQLPINATWDEGMGRDIIAPDHDGSSVVAYAIHSLFSTYFLNGTITVGSTGLMRGGNSILQSALAFCDEIWNQGDKFLDISEADATRTPCPNGTLAAAIEQLSRNFTYSLMSDRYNLPQATTTVPVTSEWSFNRYRYNAMTLCSVYGAALAVVLASMALGGLTIRRNGVVGSSNFSSFLLTTRNRDLDRVAKGYSLGADPLPKELGEMRLRFGSVEDEGILHVGFGLEGTVTPLKKGERSS